MKRIVWILCLALSTNSLQADFFSDAWNGIKKTANTIASGFEDAGKWIADRFGDTQVTRGIDFGIRLAALESAKAVAQGILEASQAISDITLSGSYEAANLAVRASEEFVDKVLKNVARATLEASYQTANGVLEGAKQTSVGVLEGTRWVVKQTLGAVDINCIHYDGSLKELEALYLGKIIVRGVLISPFEIDMSLDLKDPLSSVGVVVESIGKMMKSAFIDPVTDAIAGKAKTENFDQAVQQVTQAGQKATQAENTLAQLAPPVELVQAQATVQNAEKEIEKEKEKLTVIAADMQESLKKAAALSFDELIKFVAEQGTEITRETTLMKQELANRIRKKKKETLQAISQNAPLPTPAQATSGSKGTSAQMPKIS